MLNQRPHLRVAMALAAVALCGERAAAQISFEIPIAYGTGSDPEAVVAADFDGDGDLELLSTIHSPSRLSLVDNLGGGVFGPPVFTMLPAGVDPAGVASEDFDQDGDMDLLVVYRETDGVKFFANHGDADFVPGDFVNVGDGPNDIVAFDFDGDGDMDAAVTNRIGGSVTMIRNLGAGDFQVADTVSVGASPRGLAFGQVIGDSRPDVAVAVHGLRRLSLLRNNGGGDFSLLLNLPVGSNERPEGVGIADFDGNGYADLVTSLSDTVTHDIGMFRQTGAGTFGSLQYFDTGGVHPVGILIHDLDLDTWPDVVTVNSLSSTMSVLRNLGGVFGTAQVYPVLGPDSDFATCGDLDGNHYIDLICTNDGGNSVSVFLNARTNPSRYCTTSPNSAGSGGLMTSFGSESIATNDFSLYADQLPSMTNGLFFYGATPQEIPFHAGYLCIRPPLVRLGPPVPTGTWGDASYSVDFTVLPFSAGPAAITPGSVWNFQFWYRDPSSGFGTTNFTDAWRVVFEP